MVVFQDCPPTAISIRANSSLLGLGIPGTVIYVVEILEQYSRLEGIQQILGGYDYVYVCVPWWLSLIECLLNVRHGAKHSTCSIAFNR